MLITKNLKAFNQKLKCVLKWLLDNDLEYKATLNVLLE